MIGWRVAWKCLVAWRFGESSQQPTWPQVRHKRRWTHGEPIFKHSSQPSALVSPRGSCRCGCIRRTSVSPGVGGERGSVAEFREKGVQLGNYLRALSDSSGNALDRTRAHITDREYARQVGFERPLDVCAGAHEALVIEHHARPRQPLGIRIRADE